MTAAVVVCVLLSSLCCRACSLVARARGARNSGEGGGSHATVASVARDVHAGHEPRLRDASFELRDGVLEAARLLSDEAINALCRTCACSSRTSPSSRHMVGCWASSVRTPKGRRSELDRTTSPCDTDFFVSRMVNAGGHIRLCALFWFLSSHSSSACTSRRGGKRPRTSPTPCLT